MLGEMPPELSLERNEGWVEAGRFLGMQRVVLARLHYVGNHSEGQPESRGGGSPGYKVRGKFGGIGGS